MLALSCGLIYGLCVRLTIDLNDRLLCEVKRRAASEEMAIRQFVETALRSHLARPQQERSSKLAWQTELGRFQPGVQLENRDALLDLMEGGR